MSLIRLFLAFLQIGALSIGGGYATIPLIQSVVLEKSWLTTQEFTDIITISQMTPGPIAVNTSTFVGMRIAGLAGAVAATVGCILIGVLLSCILSNVFMKYSTSPYVKETLLALRASSTGLILSAALTIVINALFPNTSFSLFPTLVCVISFYLLRRYKINSIYLILLTGFLGILFYT